MLNLYDERSLQKESTLTYPNGTRDCDEASPQKNAPPTKLHGTLLLKSLATFCLLGNVTATTPSCACSEEIAALTLQFQAQQVEFQAQKVEFQAQQAQIDSVVHDVQEVRECSGCIPPSPPPPSPSPPSPSPPPPSPSPPSPSPPPPSPSPPSPSPPPLTYAVDFGNAAHKSWYTLHGGAYIGSVDGTEALRVGGGRWWQGRSRGRRKWRR